jgi:hypothetical protein
LKVQYQDNEAQDTEKKNPGGGEIFRTRPDRLWGPSSLLYHGYHGSGADHPPPPSSEVENE